MAVAPAARAEAPRARAKRQQIVDAARRLFLAHGFEGTSMDAITAAAGVSKRTLYKYYPSKEALLADTVYQMTLGSHDGPPIDPDRLTIRDAAELEELLTWLAGDIVAHHRDPEFLGLMRIIVGEAPRFPQIVEQYRAAVIERGYAFLTAIFERARAQGVVTTAEIDAAIRLFMGSLLIATYTHGLMTSGPARGLTRDEIEAQVHLLVSAIT